VTQIYEEEESKVSLQVARPKDEQSDEDPPAIDEEGEVIETSPAEELIPLQLRRQMAFKRGYGDVCRALVVLDDLVLVDGLNGNVDVFRTEDLMYVGTIDINESAMTSALVFQECGKTLLLLGTLKVSQALNNCPIVTVRVQDHIKGITVRRETVIHCLL